MPTYRDQAVVLRTHKLAEADRIITMLSKKHGKIRAVAKGIRKTSSRIGGRLEPFSHVDCQFYEGRNLDTITQVETIHAFDAPLREHYDSFLAGQVIVEVADKLIVEDKEPAFAYYRLLIDALSALSKVRSGTLSSRCIVDTYLLDAMALSGYALQYAHCAQCGREGSHRWFSAQLGGGLCDRCRDFQAIMPSAGAWKLLAAMLTHQWQIMMGAPDGIQREVHRMISAFVYWYIEAKIHSLEEMDS